MVVFVQIDVVLIYLCLGLEQNIFLVLSEKPLASGRTGHLNSVLMFLFLFVLLVKLVEDVFTRIAIFINYLLRNTVLDAGFGNEVDVLE